MGNFYRTRRLAPGTNAGVTIPAGNAAQRPIDPPFGTIRYNTDIGFCEFYNGSIWQPFGTGGIVNYTVDFFDGDGSTTVFTMSAEVSDPTQIQVFVGSVYQQPGPSPSPYSYTVDGSYDITFNTAPPNGMPINVILTSN